MHKTIIYALLVFVCIFVFFNQKAENMETVILPTNVVSEVEVPVTEGPRRVGSLCWKNNMCESKRCNIDIGQCV